MLRARISGASGVGFWIVMVILTACGAAAAAGPSSVPAPEGGASAAGAPVEPSVVLRHPPAEIEALLTRPLDESAYRASVRCVSGVTYRDVEFLSDRYVLFHGRSGRAWLNRLQRRCVGSRPGILMSSPGATRRLCHSDRLFQDTFRDDDRRPGFPTAKPTGGLRGGAGCVLGMFEQIDTQQALALKLHLTRARGTETVRRTVGKSPRQG